MYSTTHFYSPPKITFLRLRLQANTNGHLKRFIYLQLLFLTVFEVLTSENIQKMQF